MYELRELLENNNIQRNLFYVALFVIIELWGGACRLGPMGERDVDDVPCCNQPNKIAGISRRCKHGGERTRSGI